ncbi:MAG: FAD-dependent pyridine nucleotide-disulfide oxidoreductase [Gammaproteobacteria bacterium]|nr:FAD-dependent pyridine nucleotide-disulfide oxidoreductase [Gammaproteobacteria bacterium]
MAQVGTEHNPLYVAIVGSGPSGFYAAEALIRSERTVKIDLFERLPVPFGLVRSGVAPDHPKLKQAIQVYEKIAEAPQFNFIGNVSIGRDISVEELARHYHAVIFTCGAESDRKLGIPGENLAGSHTATEFVGWYNGHPDYRDRHFDLSHETAVIIGQGNVAADVGRILSKTVDELRHTDIAGHALEVLAESKIRRIYIVGRRGPAQAKFTSKELKEFGELSVCGAVVEPAELQLNDASRIELEDKTNAGSRKVFELLSEFATSTSRDKQRQCHFTFLKSPVELQGRSRVEKIIFEKNRLQGEPFNQSAVGIGETFELEAGLLFRSIGYRGKSLTGLPFDDKRGVFPNRDGHITDTQGQLLPQFYTAGWIKRGPTGIIGTNRADSVATVECLLQDLARLDSSETKQGAAAVYVILNSKKVRPISFSDWKKIDNEEISRGQPLGKPREKITSIQECLRIVEKSG